MSFDYERTDGRLTLHREDTRWLSSGFDGGYHNADAAHNLTVPEGFERTDLAAYAETRLEGRPSGPTLLTGVQQRHARVASHGPIEAVVTAGLSNPAVLPIDGRPRPETGGDGGDGDGDGGRVGHPGTVNVFVGTTRALDEGALAGLLATAVEAKAATLSAVTDASGTTSDAVVVGADPSGEPSRFAGSATEVGRATRICVRDALLASLESRYGEAGPPAFEAARYGVVTDADACVFQP